MSEMKLRKTKMAKACPPEAPTRMRAVRVLSRFMSRRRMNIGTRFAIMGIIMSRRRAFQRNDDIGTRRRPKK